MSICKRFLAPEAQRPANRIGSHTRCLRVHSVSALRALLLLLLIAAVPATGTPLLTEDFAPRSKDFAVSPSSFEGERLVYNVEWSPPWYLFFLPRMDAGEAELQMVGETEYRDRIVLKIVFKARSSGTLANLAGVKVDDRFEFLTDPENFCTISASMKIHEGRRMREVDVVYFSESLRLHIYEVDQAVVPHQIKKDEYKDDIPACVKDLFSALYSLRLEQLEVGQIHKTLIGSDDKVKEVESVVEKQETIETPLGKYDAWRINTIALLGGLFKDGGQFRIWLSADSRKIPVQFEAKVHVGRVLGKLKTMR